MNESSIQQGSVILESNQRSQLIMQALRLQLDMIMDMNALGHLTDQYDVPYSLCLTA